MEDEEGIAEGVKIFDTTPPEQIRLSRAFAFVLRTTLAWEAKRGPWD